MTLTVVPASVRLRATTGVAAPTVLDAVGLAGASDCGAAECRAVSRPKNALTLEPVRGLILHMVTLRCGELARMTGVSADTIRHYERIGVLPLTPRTTSGYRAYPEAAVNRVRVVQRALRIGFTLAELADIFKTRDSGGTPCPQVFELAQVKLAGIDADIAALKRTRQYLAEVLTEWDARMRKSGGQKAHLLQSLTDAVEKAGRTNFRRRQ
jgi:DNA-binding transcriptional MerR regulator